MEQRTDPSPSAEQPFANAPMRIRPVALAAAMGAAFAAGTLPSGFALIAVETDGVVEGTFIWAIASIVLALPLAVAIAVVGWRAERSLVESPPPKPGYWVLLGGGIAGLGLWAPLCAWTPVLIIASALQPRHADEYLPLAVVSLLAWLVVAASVGALAAARQVSRSRRWVKLPHTPYRPAALPTSIVVSVSAALITAMPATLWLVWLEEAWRRGTGINAVAAWALVGLGGAVLAGYLTGSFAVGAGAVNPILGRGVRMRQLEVLGAVLVGQWAVLFLYLLSPMLRNADDLRYSALCTAFVAIVIGTALWSWSRTARMDVVRDTG